MYREKENFYYNGKFSEDFGLINITLQKGLFKESFVAERDLKTSDIRGREYSFLESIYDKPLEFNLTFGFENGWQTEENLQAIKRWLTQDYFRELWFYDKYDSALGRELTKVELINKDGRMHWALIDGGSDLVHNGMKDGYINLKFRTNSPYAYSKETYDYYSNDTGYLEIENDGDLPIKPIISMSNVFDEINILNSNSSYIPYPPHNLPLFRFSNGEKAHNTLRFFGPAYDGETVTIGNNIFEYDTGDGEIKDGRLKIFLPGCKQAYNFLNIESDTEVRDGDTFTVGDTTFEIDLDGTWSSRNIGIELKDEGLLKSAEGEINFNYAEICKDKGIYYEWISDNDSIIFPSWNDLLVNGKVNIGKTQYTFTGGTRKNFAKMTNHGITSGNSNTLFAYNKTKDPVHTLGSPGFNQWAQTLPEKFRKIRRVNKDYLVLEGQSGDYLDPADEICFLEKIPYGERILTWGTKPNGDWPATGDQWPYEIPWPSCIIFQHHDLIGDLKKGDYFLLCQHKKWDSEGKLVYDNLCRREWVRIAEDPDVNYSFEDDKGKSYKGILVVIDTENTMFEQQMVFDDLSESFNASNVKLSLNTVDYVVRASDFSISRPLEGLSFTESHQVAIGSTLEDTVKNLEKAINGTGIPGQDYDDATLSHQEVKATYQTGPAISLSHKKTGILGNSLEWKSIFEIFPSTGELFTRGSLEGGSDCRGEDLIDLLWDKIYDLRDKDYPKGYQDLAFEVPARTKSGDTLYFRAKKYGTEGNEMMTYSNCDALNWDWTHLSYGRDASMDDTIAQTGEEVEIKYNLNINPGDFNIHEDETKRVIGSYSGSVTFEFDEYGIAGNLPVTTSCVNAAWSNSEFVGGRNQLNGLDLLTVYNDIQNITASNNKSYFRNFNGNWMILPRGLNRIQCNGATDFKFTCRKVFR